MLRPSTINQTVSKEEQNIAELDNRRTAIESASLEASEAKKRIEKDIEKVKQDIQIGRETIEKNNEEINKINNSILELQNLKRKEEQELQEFIKGKVSLKEEIEQDILKRNIEKDKVGSDIVELSKTHEVNKFEHSEELRKIKVEQSKTLSEVGKLEFSIKNLSSEIPLLNDKLDKLKEEIKSKNEELKSVESSLNSLKNEIETTKSLIENNKIIINQNETKKLEQEKEISDLKIEIVKNKELNDSEKSIHIGLLTKQQTLDQKTAFIKNQYERAGIRWEE